MKSKEEILCMFGHIKEHLQKYPYKRSVRPVDCYNAMDLYAKQKVSSFMHIISATGDLNEFCQKENIGLSGDSVFEAVKTEVINLRKEVERLKSLTPQWISVEDRVPEVGEYVFVIVGKDTVLKGKLMINGWTAFFADGHKLVGDQRPVTHWQPLPNAPAL